jgi:hypothetical protein
LPPNRSRLPALRSQPMTAHRRTPKVNRLDFNEPEAITLLKDTRLPRNGREMSAVVVILRNDADTHSFTNWQTRAAAYALSARWL